ncbi:MAG: hypothetical protein KKH28_09960 [Elusimicrobia bacterium]|nr:hypothetical protein [Elusimicrobiota bacterium]
MAAGGVQSRQHGTPARRAVLAGRAGGRGGGVYETEAKMQTRVLDRMLGPGKAFAFLEMSAEITNTADEQSKDGVGELRKTKSSAGSMEEEAEPMGKEEDKKADKDKKALSTQEQSSRQVDCRKHNNIIEIIDSCAAKIA